MDNLHTSLERIKGTIQLTPTRKILFETDWNSGKIHEYSIEDFLNRTYADSFDSEIVTLLDSMHERIKKLRR